MDAREHIVIYRIRSRQSQLHVATSEDMIVPFDAIKCFAAACNPITATIIRIIIQQFLSA